MSDNSIEVKIGAEYGDLQAAMKQMQADLEEYGRVWTGNIKTMQDANVAEQALDQMMRQGTISVQQ
ncbi:MAG: hypothetical protein JSR70_09440 [Proteobacteria bacterium]|nr:hypothetical protein [Pseudomonadota bacterium]